jgi:hypothetical protein
MIQAVPFILLVEFLVYQLFFQLATVWYQQRSLQVFFVVLRFVKTKQLVFAAYTKGQNEVDEFENCKRNNKAVRYNNTNGF